MSSYSLRRTAQALLVALIMSFALYNMISLLPGDPVDLMLEGNPSLTPELVAQMRKLHGVDQPVLTRYWSWLSGLAAGDMGYSNTHFKPVSDVLTPALVQTSKLMILTFVISVSASLVLGCIAAMKPGGWADNVISFVAFACISSPAFWVALIFLMVFAVKLQWVPATATALDPSMGFMQELRYLVLPVLTLTLFSMGQYIRYVRASMIETLNADFIRTARAKGLGKWTVISRHALRNALVPVVTLMALSFGSLMSGALVVETMFGVQGMGKAIYDAVMHKDFNVAMIGVLFATLITLFANLVADLAYGWLDPRISLK
ncbi:ABC transporter permease [Hydrogenophaga sp. PBL-H3]|uniref:ABC transporter permease n=1 Tax=Hydrogenophaga sp. PBL-H3 TaxID=434010 RepID=UPI00131FA849|nr:ABC transporter permease [Hydrogenophaga sp. PBL-H3]QHE74879.1 ABC transporter permease [Hydrogenophaga sp. PBL-H3]QHE79306.1 ABC transporter permease [Hydrogenophaga sp. PBL-H3]